MDGLKTFLTIVESGSLVRASEKLHVTQSTVTARLKSLEEELGQVLVLRQKSGAELTFAGQTFKRYAETMQGLWHQAKQEASLPNRIEAVCKIGCDMDLWPGLGQRFFNFLRRQYPDVAISLRQGKQGEVANWLANGQCDVGFTHIPSAGTGQQTHALPDDRLILYATRKDAVMRFNPDYVYVDAGDDFGRDHTAAYADADTARINFSSAIWALDHLLDNGGSAYLPERLAKLADGRLFAIEAAPVFSRKLYLIASEPVVSRWPWFSSAVDEICY